MRLNKLIAFLRTALLACICTFTSVHAGEPLDKANEPLSASTSFGFRAGDNTVEGYADLLVPYSVSSNALVFINPRFLLGDAGVDQVNIGVGARYLLEGKGVLGGNLYYDRRTSQLGSSFQQYGLGFEWLGNNIDARANVYRAEDKLKLVNSYNTFETVVETDVQLQRTEESSTVTNASNLGEVKAEGNGLVQDATLTDTTTTLEKVETTTTTSSTTTGRLFEQYEGTLDGWDAEIGYKLPFKMKPEVRIFAGYYDFDDPFNTDNKLKGYKGRLEVKASQFLRFDAEVYEEARNGSDYFVGVRLEVPLDGRDTFKHLKESLLGSPKQSLRNRMQSEMVMRDVQVHTDVSKPVENAKARTVKNKDEVEVESETTTKSEVGTPRSGKVVTKSNITYVDADGKGTGSGTKEDPYLTIIDAVNNAGDNNTIFVCESGGGVCDFGEDNNLVGVQGIQVVRRIRPVRPGIYNEKANGSSGIVLQDGQVLTSSISGVDLEGTAYLVETDNAPRVKNSAQADGNGVINTSGANTVNRLDIKVQGTSRFKGSGNSGIKNIENTGDVVISNNTINVTGDHNSAVYNKETNSTVTISNNSITKKGQYGVSILNEETKGTVVITGNNTVDNADYVTSIANYDTKGDVTITDNVITQKGMSSTGIDNYESEGSISISGNTITQKGDDSRAIWNDETQGKVAINDNKITQNAAESLGILNTYTQDEITINNNKITQKGKESVGVVSYQSEDSIVIDDNEIIQKAKKSAGVINDQTIAKVTVSNNKITQTGKKSAGVFNDETEGKVVINDNTLVQKGDESVGFENDKTKEKVTIKDNKITQYGEESSAVINEKTKAKVVVKDNTVIQKAKNSVGFESFKTKKLITVEGNKITQNGNKSTAVFNEETEGKVKVDSNTVIQNGNKSLGVNNFKSQGKVSIDDNKITQRGDESVGILNEKTKDDVTINDNTITQRGTDSVGIENNKTKALVNADSNKITQNANKSVGILNEDIDDDVIIGNNNITNKGNKGAGIKNKDIDSGVTLTITNNTVKMTGNDSDALLSSSVDGCQDIRANTFNAKGNNSDDMRFKSGNSISQSSPRALESDNRIVNNSVSYNGSISTDCLRVGPPSPR